MLLGELYQLLILAINFSFCWYYFSYCWYFYKHLEFSGIGLLFCQKTIDAMIHNPQTAQVFSLIIWMLLVILVIYFTIRLSSRTRI